MNRNGNGSWSGCGGVDARQLLAGLLTVGMVLMLVAHIVSSSSSPSLSLFVRPQRELELDADDHPNPNAINNASAPLLAPCWSRPTPTPTPTPMQPTPTPTPTGFITFSLSPTPDTHISQLTDAVLIAASLGAALLLPDIRLNQLGHSRNFQDMYDLHHFTSALAAFVNLTQHLPPHFATRRPAVLRIKRRVSHYQIHTQILPLFTTNNYLRLALVHPPTTTTPQPNQLYTNKHLLAASCVAMFQSLKLQPRLQQVGDNIIRHLRQLAAKSNGQFVAVDFRLHALSKSTCMLDVPVAQTKRCSNATEVASLLQKAGFGEDSVVYLTAESSWHDSLRALKNAFPKTYTKDEILPAEEKGHFLKAGNEDLEKALDIHVCSKSDTFVAAVYGPFYGHVSGRRIASGRTRILSPLQSVSEKRAQDSDFLSPFVSKKSHMAYSCYC